MMKMLQWYWMEKIKEMQRVVFPMIAGEKKCSKKKLEQKE